MNTKKILGTVAIASLSAIVINSLYKNCLKIDKSHLEDGLFLKYNGDNQTAQTALVPNASNSSNGLMKASDYLKLNQRYQNGDGTSKLNEQFIMNIAKDLIAKGLNQTTVMATVITNGSYCSAICNIFKFQDKFYGSILISGYNLSIIAYINKSSVTLKNF